MHVHFKPPLLYVTQKKTIPQAMGIKVETKGTTLRPIERDVHWKSYVKKIY